MKFEAFNKKCGVNSFLYSIREYRVGRLFSVTGFHWRWKLPIQAGLRAYFFSSDLICFNAWIMYFSTMLVDTPISAAISG